MELTLRWCALMNRHLGEGAGEAHLLDRDVSCSATHTLLTQSQFGGQC